MLDDLCDFELKEIVDDTDKKGYSEHYVTPGYERHEKGLWHKTVHCWLYTGDGYVFFKDARILIHYT